MLSLLDASVGAGNVVTALRIGARLRSVGVEIVPELVKRARA
jgi:hypothetical protein